MEDYDEKEVEEERKDDGRMISNHRRFLIGHENREIVFSRRRNSVKPTSLNMIVTNIYAKRIKTCECGVCDIMRARRNGVKRYMVKKYVTRYKQYLT